MSNKLTQEKFLEKLIKIHGNLITTNDKYISSHTKMLFHCNRELGHKDWKAVPNNILSGCGCPECGKLKIGNSHRKHEDSFVKELLISTDNGIQLAGRYYNAKTKTKFMCNLCGYTWEATPDNILRGRGCPNCKSSSGEQAVRAILEFNNISYNSQRSFSIKGKTHRLDFVIKGSDNNYYVIQPDGEQHFKSIKSWGGEEEFENRKQRDNDENRYLPALGGEGITDSLVLV